MSPPAPELASGSGSESAQGSVSALASGSPPVLAQASVSGSPPVLAQASEPALKLNSESVSHQSANPAFRQR